MLAAVGPRLLVLLTVAVGLGATEVQRLLADGSVAAAATPARVGELVAWRITGPPLPDHDRVAEHPRLVFSHADGSAVTRPLFRYRAYRQGDSAVAGEEFDAVGDWHWRCRQVFRQPGEWRWQLIAPDNSRLRAGVVSVVAAEAATGPYQLAANGLLLAHADGTGFVPVGCNICWGTGPRRLDQMKRYLTRLARAGGNHVRLWAASWCGQIEGDRPDRYRHDHAWLLDEILRHAQAEGLRVTVVLDNAHDLVHGKAFPYGADVSERIGTFLRTPLAPAYRRRLAYFMARYAAFDCVLAWELFNELDEALIGQPKPMDMQDEPRVVGDWTAAAAALVEELDPDERLVTVSLATQPWYHIFDTEAIDLAQLHAYLPPLSQVEGDDRDAIDLLLRKRQALGRPAMPFRFSETGYQGSNADNPANLLDPNGILLRNQLWGGFLLGAYGSGMNWWWDVYIDEHDLWHCFTPLAEAVAQLDWSDAELQPRSVTRGEPVQLLGWQSPAQALLWPRHPEDTWYRLTIEGRPHPTWPGGTGPSLRLPDFTPGQDFRLIGWDIDTGGERFAMTLTSTGHGSLIVHLPPGDARVALIVRQLPDPGLEGLD